MACMSTTATKEVPPLPLTPGAPRLALAPALGVLGQDAAVPRGGGAVQCRQSPSARHQLRTPPAPPSHEHVPEQVALKYAASKAPLLFRYKT
eukprot:2179104-Rhodomonas_salina.3